MRMMLKARFDTQAASKKLQDGSMPALIQRVTETLKPEAAYFGPSGGGRTAFFVFDMSDPSQLPAISEPLFAELNAHIEVFPVMNADDLQKGLSQLHS